MNNLIIMYKGAIIGFGGVAEVHVKAYEKISEIKILAIADVTPERLQTAKRKFGFNEKQLYSDFREMISKEKLDFVDICTPYRYHKEIAVVASQEGLNIICEKPLASSLAEIDEMITSAKRNNVQLIVCHNWCYLPVFQKAKELISSKILGNPYYLEYSLGKEDIIWKGSAKEYLPEWRTKVEYCGGPIMDETPHIQYLSKWLFNSDVKSVKGSIDNLNHENCEVEDFGIVINKYRNGATSVFRLNFFSSESKWDVSIQGRNALMILPSITSQTYETDPIVISSRGSINEIEISRKQNISFKEDYAFSMESLFREYVMAIEGDEIKHPIKADDGKQVVESILAAYESAVLDKEVQIPLSSRDPVYLKGVVGLKDLQVPKESIFYQKNLFQVKG